MLKPNRIAGVFSPSLHNTLHAGPHRAFPEEVLE